jgi:hypothetical protein
MINTLSELFTHPQKMNTATLIKMPMNKPYEYHRVAIFVSLEKEVIPYEVGVFLSN